jgi:hypothetical protein
MQVLQSGGLKFDSEVSFKIAIANKTLGAIAPSGLN